jgi:hypothetical protein
VGDKKQKASGKPQVFIGEMYTLRIGFRKFDGKIVKAVKETGKTWTVKLMEGFFGWEIGSKLLKIKATELIPLKGKRR